MRNKMKIKESELRQIIKEEIQNQLNEGIKEELVPGIEKIINKYFPNSFFHISSGPLSGDEFYLVKFAIGQKKDWSHGYIQNSPVNFGFNIEDKGDGKYVFIPSYTTIYIAPQKDSHYAFDTVKIPTRKKTGNSKMILKSIDKLFFDTKKLVKDNFDNLKPDSQVWVKKYI